MERENVDEAILAAVPARKGVVAVKPFSDSHREQALQLEAEAEEKGLMGFGKVLNVGVRNVLACELIYVALVDMEFDWSPYASLVLKKGDELVGEEIKDKELLAKICRERDTWVMTGDFVVYKDRIAFPHDILKKVCHFEVPGHTMDWVPPDPETLPGVEEVVFGSPAVPLDLFLKEHYFKGRDEQGLGTIIIGVRLRQP